MHRRVYTWTVPEAIDLQRSTDDWFRLRASSSGIPLGRSRALDPQVSRNWSTATYGEEPVSRRFSVVHNRDHEGVEGKANPEDDTRGIVPMSIDGSLLQFGEASETFEVETAIVSDGVLLSLPLPKGARLYGLGEKTGGLDKRGRSWIFWNTDEADHEPERDPLYQSIPVIYIVTPAGTTTVFVDSTATIYVDAGEALEDRLMLEVFDRDASLYIRRDATLPAAVRAYTGLTGRMPLPPMWALGFQQCRYSYFPESRVLEVANRMREERIPCDVLYLDIHYMEGYRVFTWDSDRFPDPEGMSKKLHEAGYHLVTIIDPGVKVDPRYDVYRTGIERNLFLSDAVGEPYAGAVWPGEAVFPDFSMKETREWWADNHTVLLDRGVDGIWNDMNEPADFTGDSRNRPFYTVPDDLVAQNDGDPRAFGLLHNGYANDLNDATRGAFGRFRPDERGFILTRAGYAGIQRSAAVWTGDNHSWWEHLAMMIPMFANLGLSGVPFVGGDAGGFQMNASGELYARWVAAASFTPFFRSHSALHSRDHEPWSFGEEILDIARTYIGLRYRLLPYIYTLFEEASRTGAPVMRPLVWEFPEDERLFNRADSFMVGPALLVAPVRERGVQERSVYLPAGVWYDFRTGERIDAGQPANGGANSFRGTTVTAEAPLDRLPLYVRGGSVLPFESLRQHTGEAGDGVLRLLVAPDADGNARGTVYEDEGEGFGYREGRYRRLELDYSKGALTASLTSGIGLEKESWFRWNRLGAGIIHRPDSAVDDTVLSQAETVSVEFPLAGSIVLNVAPTQPGRS